MKKVIVLSTVLGLSALGMACGEAPANNSANKPANNAVVNTSTPAPVSSPTPVTTPETNTNATANSNAVKPANVASPTPVPTKKP